MHIWLCFPFFLFLFLQSKPIWKAMYTTLSTSALMTSLQPFQQPVLGHYNPPNSWHYDIVITPSPAGIDIITTLSAAGNETLFGPSVQHCISAIDIKSSFLWAPKSQFYGERGGGGGEEGGHAARPLETVVYANVTTWEPHNLDFALGLQYPVDSPGPTRCLFVSCTTCTCNQSEMVCCPAVIVRCVAMYNTHIMKNTHDYF